MKKSTRPGRVAALTAAAAMVLGAVAIPVAPAHAQLALDQIYLGWDFGNGFGIGVGRVPSSYNPCPTYGWPLYPHNCMAPAPVGVVR
jgi:hypothetical protein